ncbi:MAG: YdeI/OmpD-associated family protein, partial [Bacteroidota bacterium]
EKLIQAGKMHISGLNMVEQAKMSGTWDALHQVEQLIIPPDLQEALVSYPSALKNFESFPKSTRRGILEWILNAKRPETRQKRIQETAELADQNIRANQYPRK